MDNRIAGLRGSGGARPARRQAQGDVLTGDDLPRRLTDGDASARPEERRAAALLAHLGPPAVLSPSALTRVGMALSVARTPRRSLWVAVTAAGSGVASIVCAAILAAHLHAGSPTEVREVSVPAGGSAQLDGKNRWRMALTGPGTVRIDERTGRTLLRRGRLTVKAQEAPVEVEAAAVVITVPPTATAEIEVTLVQAVRVAAFRRAVVLLGADGTERITVPPGTEWTSGAGWREPDGIHEITDGLPAAAATPGSIQGPPVETTAGPVPPPVHAATSSRRVPAPGRVASARPSDLAAESHLLGIALRKLRVDSDADGALASLDEYRARFPRGTLAREETVARVEAFLKLGRSGPALRALDGLALGSLPRGSELLVLRGELRAETGRCGEAIDDFDATLARASTGLVTERALYGRASCRGRRGAEAAARADLAQYLARFPDGRFAVAARSALAPR